MRESKLRRLLADIEAELKKESLAAEDRQVLVELRDELRQRIEAKGYDDLNPLVERINFALAEAEAGTRYPFLLLVSQTLTSLSNAGL